MRKTIPKLTACEMKAHRLIPRPLKMSPPPPAAALARINEKLTGHASFLRSVSHSITATCSRLRRSPDLCCCVRIDASSTFLHNNILCATQPREFPAREDSGSEEQTHSIPCREG